MYFRPAGIVLQEREWRDSWVQELMLREPERRSRYAVFRYRYHKSRPTELHPQPTLLIVVRDHLVPRRRAL